MVNNVVTTQVTSDLKTKLSYRYLDYDNQTPQLQIADWAITDATSAKGVTNNYAPVNPLMVGYIRQNAAAEATYRPVNSVNMGTSYNYEHYDFTRFDASSTGEGTFKAFTTGSPPHGSRCAPARPMVNAARAITIISAMSAFSNGLCRGLRQRPRRLA